MKRPCSSDNLNGAAGGHAIALLGIAVSDPESTLGGAGKLAWSDLS